MSLHPLTPRKPELRASIIGYTVAVLLTAAAFIIIDLIFPPVAWVPVMDSPAPAGPSFLLHGLLSLLDGGAAHGPIDFVIGLIELPERIVRMAIAFDIGMSLTVRSASAALVGLYAGLEIRSAILASMLAEPAVEHVSGLRLLSGKAAIRSLKTAWTRRFGNAPGIELADGLRMPRPLEAEHILITGGTGAGKTTILQTILGSALKLGDRMLVLDVKGDMTARVPSADIVILSLDDRRAARWDIGRDIRTRDDALEFAIELVAETSDPSWSSGARRVLAALVQVLQRKSADHGRSWNWRHLDALLRRPVAELHAFLKPEHPAEAAFIDVTNEAMLKQVMSFYLVLITNAGLIASACAMARGKHGQPLSIREWAEGRGAQVLLLQQSPRQPELSATIARLVLKIVADAVVSRAMQEKPSPIWLALDELPQLGKCAAVPRLAAIGRSAGVRLIAVVQSPAQLRDVYGHEAAQALIDNFATKIVGRVASGGTATEISGVWIGQRTVRWFEENGFDSNGRPRRESRTKDIPVVDPAMLSDELGLHAGSFGKAGVHALVVGHGNVARLFWPVGTWPLKKRENEYKS